MIKEIRKWGRYRHINCIDIDMLVIGVNTNDEKQYRLYVAYIDQITNNQIGEYDSVTVKLKDFHNWIRI